MTDLQTQFEKLSLQEKVLINYFKDGEEIFCLELCSEYLRITFAAKNRQQNKTYALQFLNIFEAELETAAITIDDSKAQIIAKNHVVVRISNYRSAENYSGTIREYLLREINRCGRDCTFFFVYHCSNWESLEKILEANKFYRQ